MVLVDSSAWVAYNRGRGNARLIDCLGRLLEQGEVVTCPVVILELARGAVSERDYHEILGLFTSLRCLDLNERIWKTSYHLAFDLARSGLTVPVPDLLIASVAVANGCSLLHQDALYDRMAEESDLEIYKF